MTFNDLKEKVTMNEPFVWIQGFKSSFTPTEEF